MIPWTRGTRAAAAAATLAGGLAAAAGVEAVRLDPVGRSGLAAAAPTAPKAAARTPFSEEQILAAVARDPFHPERRRPDGRFPVTPGSGGDRGQAPPPPRPSEPLHLVGTTVLAPGKGFALLVRGRARPELVHVGGRFGAWQLTELARGRVVLESPDSTLVLEIEGHR